MYVREVGVMSEKETPLITVEEIRKTIVRMAYRYESGRGTLSDAMCRLSFPMALALLNHLELHRGGEVETLDPMETTDPTTCSFAMRHPQLPENTHETDTCLDWQCE
jgi:hypothetical protein